jgi:hypothetical protein
MEMERAGIRMRKWERNKKNEEVRTRSWKRKKEDAGIRKRKCERKEKEKEGIRNRL